MIYINSKNNLCDFKLKFIIVCLLITSIKISFGQVLGEVRLDTINTHTSRVVIDTFEIKQDRITKPWVIYSEFEFQIGDTIPYSDFVEQLNQGRTNLVRRGLFLTVDIYAEFTGSKVTLKINLIERWHVWIIPRLKFDSPNISEFFHRKDWSRLSYGVFVGDKNFLGTGHELDVSLLFGNTIHGGLRYKIPTFRKKKILGISVYAMLKMLRTVPYSIENDQQELFRQENTRSLNNIIVGTKLTVKNGFHIKHYFDANLEYINISDSLQIIRPDYLSDSLKDNFVVSLKYQFEYDLRDEPKYPLKGLYLNLEFHKRGLGFLSYLKESTDLFFTKADFRFYQPIGKLFNWAFKFKAHFSPNKNQPFYYRTGLGYNSQDFLRGYEYYTIEGNNYLYFKTQFKIKLLNKIFKLPAGKKRPKVDWPFGLYLNTFSDLGYISNHFSNGTNQYPNEFLIGFGAGIDFVTFYDLVFRFEYSATKELKHSFKFGFSAAF
jgi:outer membrane protein assembly factor BamA